MVGSWVAADVLKLSGFSLQWAVQCPGREPLSRAVLVLGAPFSLQRVLLEQGAGVGLGLQ